MKTALEVIFAEQAKDVLNMLDAIKLITSTEMDETAIKTVEIYIDTIKAIITNNPDYMPEEPK